MTKEYRKLGLKIIQRENEFRKYRRPPIVVESTVPTVKAPSDLTHAEWAHARRNSWNPYEEVAGKELFKKTLRYYRKLPVSEDSEESLAAKDTQYYHAMVAVHKSEVTYSGLLRAAALYTQELYENTNIFDKVGETQKAELEVFMEKFLTNEWWLSYYNSAEDFFAARGMRYLARHGVFPKGLTDTEILDMLTLLYTYVVPFRAVYYDWEPIWLETHHFIKPLTELEAKYNVMCSQAVYRFLTNYAVKRDIVPENCREMSDAIQRTYNANQFILSTSRLLHMQKTDPVLSIYHKDPQVLTAEQLKQVTAFYAYQPVCFEFCELRYLQAISHESDGLNPEPRLRFLNPEMRPKPHMKRAPKEYFWDPTTYEEKLPNFVFRKDDGPFVAPRHQMPRQMKPTRRSRRTYHTRAASKIPHSYSLNDGKTY